MTEYQPFLQFRQAADTKRAGELRVVLKLPGGEFCVESSGKYTKQVNA
jgi:hypothetical protein